VTNVLSVLILLANIGVLALSVKLYTEFFKQVAQMKRRNERGEGK
jgi:hypothetical protein